MFFQRRYQKLLPKNPDSDDDYVESTLIRDFGDNRYDRSIHLHLPKGNVTVVPARASYLRCLALGCLYACILATFGLMTVSATIYTNWFVRHINIGSATNTISWRREFDALTELSAETFDVNGDGVLDVLTSGSSGPCIAIVRALDGSNGDTLFQTTLSFDVFALNCNADLNLDGHVDCLLAGRFGGFAAIQGQDGTLLWYVDSSIVFPRYGFYFPLLVRDLDGDGVNDVINTHGGDTKYLPHDRNRSPGYLVVVSGRTGEKLMNRIPVPDGRETYSSPVMHRLPDGREMVLFGTGGETIEGSLWAVTLDSIHKRVQEYISQFTNHHYQPHLEFINPYCTNSNISTTEALRPVFNASLYSLDHISSDINCEPWGYVMPVRTSLGLCVYEIIASKHKGVMLPVLLVDMNEDKQLDLVVSLFDAHTAVLDGTSLAVLWNKHFPDSESYSVPCPVFYNDDNIPDILVRANFGTWNVYQYSDVAILEGKSGTVLWTMRSSNAVMSSSVVLRAHHHGNDGAVFVTLGQSIEMDSHTHTLRDATRDSNVCFRDYLDEPSRSCASHVTRGHEASPSHVTSDANGHEASPSHVTSDANGHEASPSHVTSDANGHEASPSHVTSDANDHEASPSHVTRDANGHEASPSQHDNTSDLWEGSDFPSPENDFDGFLHYCNFTKEHLSSYLYFVVPSMIKTDQVRPLETFPPYIDVKAHTKRDAQHSSTEDLGMQSPQTLRCMHVMSPMVLPATPALSDLDGNGDVEVIVLTPWSSTNGRYQVSSYEVKVFTLKQKAEQVFDNNPVDSNQFLPINQQPWTKYMGQMGTGVCIN